MIKNIILDIGNVLVDFRYCELMVDLGISEVARKAIEDKCVLNPLWDQLDLGIEPEQTVYEKMIQNTVGYEKECKLFLDGLLDVVKTYPYTVSWIKELKAAGFKVYLLSNYPKTLFELHEKERFGFSHLVDGKVVSAFVKMSKPDPGIYKYLLNEYGLKPEECLFFDDRPVNIEAARKLGFNAEVFTNYETARKDIIKYGNI